jgi:hypothetical protein
MWTQLRHYRCAHVYACVFVRVRVRVRVSEPMVCVFLLCIPVRKLTNAQLFCQHCIYIMYNATPPLSLLVL